jgi:hypothetical protein
MNAPTASPHQEPAVLFVLGAGASAPDGVPLQRDILPHIRRSDDPSLARTRIGRGLRSFLDRWFGPSNSDRTEPSLEEVFAFLDTLIRHREDLSKDYPLAALEEVREWLVKCIHYAVYAHRASTPETYRAFWRAVARAQATVSVLSLNYDTALEEAFDPLYPATALLDLCMPLINYDDPEGMDPFNWWIDPRGARADFAESAVAVKLVKLHGSLSWQYCRACREVMFTPWNRAIDLDTGHFLRVEGASCFEPEERVYMHTCPYCGCAFETLILPPAHQKDMSHPIVSQLSRVASREVRRATRIVFVGYSFPEADVHLRVLFARSMRSQEIVVVNPKITAESLARYRSLTANCRVIEKGFAEFVGDGDLAALLK